MCPALQLLFSAIKETRGFASLVKNKASPQINYDEIALAFGLYFFLGIQAGGPTIFIGRNRGILKNMF